MHTVVTGLMAALLSWMFPVWRDADVSSSRSLNIWSFCTTWSNSARFFTHNQSPLLIFGRRGSDTLSVQSAVTKTFLGSPRSPPEPSFSERRPGTPRGPDTLKSCRPQTVNPVWSKPLVLQGKDKKFSSRADSVQRSDANFNAAFPTRAPAPPTPEVTFHIPTGSVCGREQMPNVY